MARKQSQPVSETPAPIRKPTKLPVSPYKLLSGSFTSRVRLPNGKITKKLHQPGEIIYLTDQQARRFRDLLGPAKDVVPNKTDAEEENAEESDEENAEDENSKEAGESEAEEGNESKEKE